MHPGQKDSDILPPYEVVDAILYRMIEEGQRLMDEGASTEFLLGLGLEYRFITQYLIGEIPDRDDMLAQLAHAIKKFAKRQMTWFRRNPNIVWLDMQGDAYAQACEAVEAFLKK